MHPNALPVVALLVSVAGVVLAGLALFWAGQDQAAMTKRLKEKTREAEDMAGQLRETLIRLEQSERELIGLRLRAAEARRAILVAALDEPPHFVVKPRSEHAAQLELVNPSTEDLQEVEAELTGTGHTGAARLFRVSALPAQGSRLLNEVIVLDPADGEKRLEASIMLGGAVVKQRIVLTWLDGEWIATSDLEPATLAA
jgi:hypothetical protein